MAVAAPQRRFAYGLNVGISVVAAIALLVLAIWLAERFDRRLDVTSTGVNSLSPRTEKLLHGLGQDVRITGVYAVLTEYDKVTQKRRDRVRDLLQLYEAGGGSHVTAVMIDPMKDPAAVTEMLDRLKNKPVYKQEAEPHRAALAKFPELNGRVAQTADAHVQSIEAMRQTNRQIEQVREIGIIQLNLESVSSAAQKITETITELEGNGEIPQYGRAVQAARDHLTQCRRVLAGAQGWIAEGGANQPPVQSEARSFFEQAGSEYTALMAEIDTFLSDTEKLERVKLEDLYATLARWTNNQPPILVETDEEARILSLDDVWPYPTDRSAPPPPDGDPRQFAGERAISSAILQLTQKDKTAVVFTYYGGMSKTRSLPQMNPMQRMPPAPYEGLAEMLGRENFVVEDWDVKSAKQPPAVEGASRTVYVVFPPEPPPQPNPMQPPSEAPITDSDKQLIYDAVAASGMAVFLTGWAQPTSPMLPLPGTYEFADYLRSKWGVDVQYRHLALQYMASPEKPELSIPANPRNPLMMDTQVIQFTEHPVAEPLQALRAAFTTVAPLAFAEHRCDCADESEFVSFEEKAGDDGLVTRTGTREDQSKQVQSYRYPLDRWNTQRAREHCEKQKGTFQPAEAGDVDIAAIARVRDTGDVWAADSVQRIQNDLQTNQGTRPGPGDILAPFPIALTASKEDRRIAVFASEDFASDRFTQATGLERRGNSFVMFAAYPANADLFLNTIHWLTGDAERIAVGPQQGEVGLLDGLKADSMLPFYKAILVGAGPLLALLAGGAVWLVRRR